ncbi:type I-B CRISPR-associated protein Cas7/Cst2/DevR [Candidatus Micrarchaeota archaeon]|nr:MAG: type I-B CRISPR-associated protein Cas7/Cst2/DevR [Candidatus Micrarchaeota archaeon]
MKRVLISILARIKGNVNANGTVAALTEIKKFFTTDGETRVYVSGRCVKYCIKQRLSEKGFELSPLERPRRVVISKGNPVLYIDDDLFGFMMAEVPGEAARRRFAPIKTDGIVALKHCEITRDFGGRFDPAEKEMPSPFEVEVADFIGQNNWIITENIGRFEDKEITEDIIRDSSVKLEERDENGKKFYYLPTEVDDADRKYGRKDRLRAFLEVLLKERYTFPRSATGLHQPQYYYAVILPTERLLPLFAHIDYEVKNGKVILNLDKIEDLGSLLMDGEKITIVDFEDVLDEEIKLRIEDYRKRIEELENKLKSANSEELKKKLEEEKQELKIRIKTLETIEIVNPYKIDNVIDEITDYLIGA